MTVGRIVYEDDLVQLWHGDYRDHLDMIGPGSVDAVITDPPYGETSLKWDRWPIGWVDHVATLTSSLWCFGSFRMFHEHASDFEAWKFSQDIIWEKHNGSGFHADRFKRVHESATLWYRGDWEDIHHVTPTTADAVKRATRRKLRPAHTGQIERGHFTSEDGGPRLMRSVQFVRSEHGRAVHPTQKPLGIVSPLIEYSVPRGGLVVDPFGGSYTTALAARMSGRRCIAFEAIESHALAGVRRFEQMAFDFGELA